MREIKFRGKEIDTGKWVYGFYLEQDICNMGSKNTKRDLLIKDAGVIVQNSKCNSGTVIDKKTIGQYTGLKDKNGKEIYEGDIVQAVFEDEEEAEIKGIVIYAEAGAYYMVIVNNGDEWDLGYLDKIEKIGNIYDNP